MTGVPVSTGATGVLAETGGGLPLGATALGIALLVCGLIAAGVRTVRPRAFRR